MQTDGQGMSALARLPPGRHWIVLGNEGGGNGYELWLQWSGKNVQMDVAPNGLHSGTLFPCFPDAFVYVTGATNTLYLIAVTE